MILFGIAFKKKKDILLSKPISTSQQRTYEQDESLKKQNT